VNDRNPGHQLAALRAKAVLEALTWLDTPYCHQAAQKGQGADCLGLVRGVHSALLGKPALATPPYNARWNQQRREELLHAAQTYLHPVSQAQPGDVVLFRMRRTLPITHCGILLDKDQFIHAFDGRGVISTRFADVWRQKAAAYFAFGNPL